MAARMKFHIFLVVFFYATAVLFSNLASCTRFGLRSNTIHFPPEKKSSLPGSWQIIEVSTLQTLNSNLNPPPELRVDKSPAYSSDGVLRRRRRQAEPTAPKVSPTPNLNTPVVTPNVTSKFLFNDSHHQMMIHWAGEGSPIILALSRDIRPGQDSSSQLYISYNYGKTFQPLSLTIACPDANRTGKTGVIDKFYHSETHNSHYIFPDTLHNVLFLTKDFGQTITQSCLPFRPDQVAVHSDNSDLLLAMEENDPSKRLWGTQNFGITWVPLHDNVKSFFWGVPPWDAPNDIYIERIDAGGNVVFRQSAVDFGRREEVIGQVVDFEVRQDYLFATRSVHLLGAKETDTLQLWVSHLRQPFENAQLPPEIIAKDFYVADASEEQVFLIVNDNDNSTDLYISEVRGTKFSLSLRRVVYYNPEGAARKDTWLRWYVKESFADIHKVDGLRSVYIASQLINATDLSVENQRSWITFDKGGMWEPLRPPKLDSEKQSFYCTENQNNCSLHFSQLLSRWYPGTHTAPILSHKSAPGLVMASGVVGANLSKTSPEDIFLSTDAGVSWNAVLKGHYMYEFGDHGGLIVAVKQYHLTRRLEYSWNEGQTWETVFFSDEEMHVYGLLTEPGEMTTIFSVFGSLPGKHSWALIQVDLRSIFPYTCGANDYKDWAPGDGRYDQQCLLGSKNIYQRRIAHAKCYNGRYYTRPVQSQNCTCTRADFECDFGFMPRDNGPASANECVADPFNKIDPDRPPVPCIDFYDRTRGYRKIAGDECSGGEEHRYMADKFACPLSTVTEFLLYTTRSQAYRYVIGSNVTQAMNFVDRSPAASILAIDYDYKRNCVYYADDSSIRSMCYSGNREDTVLIKSVTQVVALRYDWMSDNIYWIDLGRKQLAVARSDGRFKRILLKNNTGADIVRLDQPRGLALDPIHGYLFFTDTSRVNPRIVRTWLDGTHPVLMMESNPGLLAEPTGITYDQPTERVYFTDTRNGYVGSVNVDGNDFRRLVSTLYPKCVTTYKGNVYWYAGRYQVFTADKYYGNDATALLTGVYGLMDMVAIHHGSQQGTNACGAQNGACSHLCTGRPQQPGQHGQNRTCLCPGSFDNQKAVLPDGNERCMCNGNEVLNATDGECHARSNATGCGPSQLMCGTGRCVPRSWQCDHDDDCGDMTDEVNCPYQSCRSDMFRCGNNRCVPSQWRCDHDNDCHDNSDEEHCKYAPCNSTQFACTNGRCISPRWVCDFDNDCHDHSDEENCTYNITTPSYPSPRKCNTTSYHCQDGSTCIPRSWVCDGAADCPSGEDERKCNASRTSTCAPWQFTCTKSGACLQMSWVCDGAPDCGALDRSDEEGCENQTTTMPMPLTTFPPYQCHRTHYLYFSCRNGNCVPTSSRCDHINDCGDSSDEDYCYWTTLRPAVCGSDQFRCTDGRCIADKRTCDGFNDCGDNSDEMKPNCAQGDRNQTCQANQYVCEDGWCIYASWVCDGEADCNSGEDERNCTVVSRCRPPERFQCLYSEGCIPAYWLCDGDKDCADGSDELKCNHSVTLSPSTVRPMACDGGLFRCADFSDCLMNYRLCDGRYDCSDGSDEQNCKVDVGVTDLHVAESDVSTLHIRWISPNPRTGGNYKFIPSIRSSGDTWSNRSEVADLEYVFSKLLGDTSYFITIYTVFISTDKKHTRIVYPPVPPITVSTLEGAPNEPFLNVPEILPSGAVKLSWKAPQQKNGMVRFYTIYLVAGGHTRQIHVPNTADPQTTTVDDLDSGLSYSITVSATTVAEGPPSVARVLKYHQDTITSRVTNLDVNGVTLNGATLTWKQPQNVTDVVLYKVELFTGDRLVGNYTTTIPNYRLSGLTSGTTYTAVIIINNKHGDGPGAEIMFATTGAPPPRVTNVMADLIGNNVARVTWDAPEIKNITWSYKVFYDYKGEDMQEHTIRQSALNVSITGVQNVIIRDLYGCEQYFIRVMISGPRGEGPLSDQATVRTSYDATHKPKHVDANYQNGSLTVSWLVDCDYIVEPLGYIIRGIENGTSHDFKVAPSKSSNMSHSFTRGLRRGGTYSFGVKADVPHGIFSEPIIFRIPPYSAPTDLRLQLLLNQDVLISWECQDDGLVSKQFEVHFAHQHDSQISAWQLLATAIGTFFPVSREALYDRVLGSESTLVGLSVKPNKDEKLSMSFSFKVRRYVPGAYPGEFSTVQSTEVDLSYHSMVIPASSLTQTNWIAIVVSSTVICLTLVVALLVYIVRHRRLQRSFLMFANSHYDTRSGTTRFSAGDHDLEGDEDQPMITGFSDDEPLVIA